MLFDENSSEKFRCFIFWIKFKELSFFIFACVPSLVPECDLCWEFTSADIYSPWLWRWYIDLHNCIRRIFLSPDNFRLLILKYNSLNLNSNHNLVSLYVVHTHPPPSRKFKIFKRVRCLFTNSKNLQNMMSA